MNNLIRNGCRNAVTARLPEELSNWEELDEKNARRAWNHFSALFESHGFVLFGTPAYERGPSPPNKPPANCFHPTEDEDFVHRVRTHKKRLHFPFVRTIGYMGLDSCGRNCHIKALRPTSRELRVIRTLTSEGFLCDPRNHTVPVLRIIETDDWAFVIQPWWGENWMEPTTDFASRWIIAHELLEGLAFMHERGIAHGDIHPGNILCNHETARSIDNRSPNFQTSFEYRLGFIDFESATMFPQDASNHFIIPEDSCPPSAFVAPEQELQEPYDAFKADIYNLGQVLRHELRLSEEKANDKLPIVPEAYAKLLDRMTMIDPPDRVNACEALKMLQEIGQATGVGKHNNLLLGNGRLNQ